jgi:D-3-phosphoglycerate dehydrogenase
MAVGRAGDVPGGAAIGVLNLDSVPPRAAVEEVLQQDHIRSVDVIQLPPAGKVPPWLSADETGGTDVG